MVEFFNRMEVCPSCQNKTVAINSQPTFQGNMLMTIKVTGICHICYLGGSCEVSREYWLREAEYTVRLVLRQIAYASR